MKRVILVAGRPGEGKSHLAKSLVTQHSFVDLSVDQAYVDFIKQHCPMLYLDALHLYIGPHYHAILSERDYSRAHLGRDFVAEWRRYLVTRIAGLTSLEDSVVVEGYLLKWWDQELNQSLASSVQVFVVLVKGRRYFYQGRELTTVEVARLGSQQGA